MGSAVSLPFLSVLALPFYSGTTTSLNVLFLTLNWYILLLSHPPLQVEIYGTLITRFIFYLAPSLLFLAFDLGIPSLSSEIKSQGELALPGRHGRRKLGNIVFWSLTNLFLGIGLQAGVELLSVNVLGLPSALSVSKSMPSPFDMFRTVLKLLTARGTLQFLIHRYILHAPKSPITKLHLTWAHSIPVPFPMAASFDHPVAYLLHHWVPLFLPGYLFRAHLLPFLLTVAVTSVEELFTYSGYSATLLPSAIMLPGMARRIDNHYLVRGKGNFAAFGALDWICGTSVGRDIADDMAAEWDHRDGDAKVSEATNAAGNFIEGAKERTKRFGRKRRQ